jgi:hypothetical protein
LVQWIQELRRFAYGIKDASLKAPVADDIFNNFKKLTGFEVQDLSQLEQTELKHYFCDAAGLGAL